MEVTFLGTGTSHGIPVLSCDCPVCSSDTKENHRLRSSLLVKDNEVNIVIDTTPEFRIQGVRAKLKDIDALLFTHAHADHLHGIDDVRAFSIDKKIPAYGNESTLKEIKTRFSYIFNTTTQKGGGKPNLSINLIDKPITIGGLTITPVPIKHGVLNINGYRINKTAYLTDCSSIPESSYKLLEGLETLIIGALRYREHSTHFTIDQAIEEIRKINPKKAYFTHICHEVDHFTLIKELKVRGEKEELIKKIKPAHDGLCLKSE